MSTDNNAKKAILTGDTLVLTPNGYNCIKNIKKGETIIGINNEKNEALDIEVLETQSQLSSSIVSITTAKGTMQVAPKTIFTLEDNTLMEAKDLLDGSIIKSLGGYLLIKSLGTSQIETMTYNLKTAGDNNFFISKQDALVQGIQVDMTSEEIEAQHYELAETF